MAENESTVMLCNVLQWLVQSFMVTEALLPIFPLSYKCIDKKNEKKSTADCTSCFKRYSFHIVHLQESGRICKKWFYHCSHCNYESIALIAVILWHVYDVNASCWYPKYELNLSTSPWGSTVTIRIPYSDSEACLPGCKNMPVL